MDRFEDAERFPCMPIHRFKYERPFQGDVNNKIWLSIVHILSKS